MRRRQFLPLLLTPLAALTPCPNLFAQDLNEAERNLIDEMVRGLTGKYREFSFNSDSVEELAVFYDLMGDYHNWYAIAERKNSHRHGIHEVAVSANIRQEHLQISVEDMTGIIFHALCQVSGLSHKYREVRFCGTDQIYPYWVGKP